MRDTITKSNFLFTPSFLLMFFSFSNTIRFTEIPRKSILLHSRLPDFEYWKYLINLNKDTFFLCKPDRYETFRWLWISIKVIVGGIQTPKHTVFALYGCSFRSFLNIIYGSIFWPVQGIRGNLWYLISLRHLIWSVSVTNRIYFFKKTFSPLCVCNMF